MNVADLPVLLGGTPVRPEGPPPWPLTDPEVADALKAALADGSWGKYEGGRVAQLERRLMEYHEVAHVLTCGSGTFAVEVALRALRIGPGDEVILAAYDYPGNFLSVHALGALPVLVDIHPDSWQLDPGQLGPAIGPATKAIIASHLHGGVVHMRDVMAVAAAHRLSVVEDAAQCPGAMVQGRRAGTWGDVGVLSFGGSKLLTAGRGGAILTARADLAQRARTYLNRGNLICPLSELQAAVLLPQFAKLEERNARRSASVLHLRELLRSLPGIRPYCERAGESRPGYYKLGLQYDAEAFGLPRGRLVAAARAEGVALDEGFRALHVGRSPSRYRVGGTLVEATRAHEGTLVLHHPVLLEGERELGQLAEALHKIHSHAECLKADR